MSWYGELPDRWESIRIKNIFVLRDERNTRSMDDVRLLSLYTSIGVLPHDKVEKITGNRATTVENYKIVHIGDIIVNIILCWQGAIGLSKWNGVTSPAYDVYCAKSEGKIDVRYYNYLMRTPQFSGECFKNGRGIMAMRWRTYSNEFSSIVVPVPPIDEQEQIARFLDWKVTRINKLTNALKKQIALLTEQKQAIINAAVTKGGERWKYRRLKSLVTDVNKKALPNGTFYVGMENVVSWTGAFLHTGSIVDGDCKQFKIGDVLFGKLRPYLAKVYIPETNGVCSGEFLCLRGFDGCLPYLKYFLLSYDFVMLVNASTCGAKMPRANWTFVGNCQVPFPPLDEQLAIVTYLNEQCGTIDSTIAAINRQIALLTEYRTRLISDVVTGKLDVRGVVVPEYDMTDAASDKELPEDTELDEEDGANGEE
jgi:type I restriction enzyme S subunit